ncbi:MAG: hypothetical protein HLUCCA11_05725 [Phormidesmis priestleyi Ana]|uniref:Uncharacterized protein n=1 Tax=Phormidesmis priestleyi Ana TaxID=1666911 RepID=A0A0P8BRN8_9CYAN|nr:MAG: hypothetical protein HLUCCA11_05725 [Phormidesmis priestleyi Ana]
MKRVFRLFPPRRNAVNGEQTPVSYARSPVGEAIIRLRLSSPAALLMPFESFPVNFGHALAVGNSGEDENSPESEPESELENEETHPILNLNKDLVDYLFARVAELGDESLLLRVTLPSDPAPSDPALPKTSQTNAAEFPACALHNAIQRYFAHLENIRRQSLTKLAWDAALLGLLGAGALSLSVFLDARNAAIADVSIGSLLLNQGITVFGWLTLWEALANALWNWRPLYQQQQMCRRLQLAKFELTTDVVKALKNSRESRDNSADIPFA